MTEDNVAFDDILDLTGRMGRWQWGVLALSSIIVALAGMFNNGIIFLAATPEYFCTPPVLLELTKGGVDASSLYSKVKNLSLFSISGSGVDSSLYDDGFEADSTLTIGSITTDSSFQESGVATSSLSSITTEGSNILILNANTESYSVLASWLPYDNRTGWSHCHHYQSANNPGQLVTCNDWMFSREQYQSTWITEWNMVCKHKWKKSASQTAIMVGIMIGAALAGVLGDTIGKQKVIWFSIPVLIVASFAAVYVKHFYVFLLLRSLLPAANTVMYSSFFVLCLEIVGKEWRSRIGFLYQLPYSIGYMLFPCVAYYVRDWRTLHMYISYPSLICVIYFWFVPESPRWLASKGRFREAAEILKRMARINGRNLPDDNTLLTKLSSCKEISSESTTQPQQLQKKLYFALVTALGLVKSKKQRTFTLVNCFNWGAVGLIYYGVVFDAAQLSDNAYLVVILAASVEPLAYLVSAPLIDRWGRRPGLALAHLITALSILGFALVPSHFAWLKLTLGAVGKFSVTAAFSMLFIYSAECFPTSVRNIGFCLCSVSARIGGGAAPFVAFMASQEHKKLPSVIFVGFAIIAALGALLFMPETRKRKLPETIDEIEGGHFQMTRKAGDMHLNSLTT